MGIAVSRDFPAAILLHIAVVEELRSCRTRRVGRNAATRDDHEADRQQ